MHRGGKGDDDVIGYHDYVTSERREIPTMARSYNMSSAIESPDETRRHAESAYSRQMYTADSKYRWKKVQHANLDLFVMERNERHLTSLQWKWQKMSRAKKRFAAENHEPTSPRRREAVDPTGNPPPADDDAEATERERSGATFRRGIGEMATRGQSRQTINEDLEAHFYERWRAVEEQQRGMRLPHSGYSAPHERQRHLVEGRFNKYPRDHLSSYPRHQPNINYIYTPDYEGKHPPPPHQHHFLPPAEVVFHNYPHYNQQQQQGRFEYVDPWLMKKEQQAFYESNVNDKSVLIRTTNRLMRQQNETEKQLQDLRQLLKVELDEQDESCERDERTQERIDELERQIDSLGGKLERINLEIGDSRLNSQNVSLESHPPSTPLFVLDSAHHRGVRDHKFSMAFNEDDELGDDDDDDEYYQNDGDDEQTSAYDTLDHVESALEETKIQQEELKHDLQVQMMNMRAELEKQLANKVVVAEPGADPEMEARVTLLERQIEEMQGRIAQADVKIADAELEKRKIQERRKKSQQEQAIKRSKKKKRKSGSVEKSQQQVATTPTHKRLISKTSSKVSPAPERKKSNRTASTNNQSCNRSSKKSEHSQPQSPLSSPRTAATARSTAKSKSKSNRSANEPSHKSPKQSTRKSTRSSGGAVTQASETPSSRHKPLSRLSSNKPSDLVVREVSSPPSGSGELTPNKLILHEEGDEEAKSEADSQACGENNFEEVPTDGEGGESALAKAKRDFKAFFNFKGLAFKRKKRRKSVLHGLGSLWCVCPDPVWKYLGDEQDEELVTRRKCISLILGVVLIVLLLAIVASLAIGLSGSEPPVIPTEAPLQFSVIEADGS